ncbi:MAG: uracil-DNA glycosylase [Planctomycetota bacterium]|jgi:DNA polymerase
MEAREELSRDLAGTLRARALYQGAKRVAAPGEARAADPWKALCAEALGCTACRLCETRTHVVFGEGSLDAELMFVGEAPGRDEDQQARPFVGRAGRLLTQMILAMGFSRGDVYIANVLKCRPPENRDPAPDEVDRCLPYLLRQIEVIQPKIICALGRHALRSLTGYKGGITKVRGRPMEFLAWKVMPTFHPAYLLRNPAAKREAWEDLKAVLQLLGRPVPSRKKPRG